MSFICIYYIYISFAQLIGLVRLKIHFVIGTKININAMLYITKTVSQFLDADYNVQ